MTELGNDALLAEVADPASVMKIADADQAQLAAEEARVVAASPASDEPGEAHADPDETPAGAPPEYDPLPPEEGA